MVKPSPSPDHPDIPYRASVAEARFNQNYPEGLLSHDDVDVRREAYTDLISWDVPQARAEELTHYHVKYARQRANQKRKERGQPQIHIIPTLSASLAIMGNRSIPAGRSIKRLDRLTAVAKIEDCTEEWALSQLLAIYNFYGGAAKYIEAMSVLDRILQLKGFLRSRKPVDPQEMPGQEPAEEIVRQLAAARKRPAVLSGPTANGMA